MCPKVKIAECWICKGPQHPSLNNHFRLRMAESKTFQCKLMRTYAFTLSCRIQVVSSSTNVVKRIAHSSSLTTLYGHIRKAFSMARDIEITVSYNDGQDLEVIMYRHGALGNVFMILSRPPQTIGSGAQQDHIH
jgi:hypothetical protein